MISLTQGEQNLFLLKKSLPDNDKLFLWCYSKKGTIFSSHEADQEVFQQAFAEFGGLQKAMEHQEGSGSAGPELIGSPIGLHWAVIVEWDRGGELTFVMGPVLFRPISREKLKKALQEEGENHRKGSWKKRLAEIAVGLPVMSRTVFARYAVLMHNTLNGDQLETNALHDEDREKTKQDWNSIYLAQRALLQMVTNGDINYQSTLQSSAASGSASFHFLPDPLKQAKTSAISFTALVCRAAIEGGLSPEAAYPLEESYFRTVEDCRSTEELSSLVQAMYHDFIYRVHCRRENPEFSRTVQKCCDYIELNLDRKISAADLAALSGYSEYYLTERFKKETGLTVSQYVRFSKIERARVLLISTGLTIGEIADQLAFSTPSFFIRCFHEVTGYTPAQYRKRFC